MLGFGRGSFRPRLARLLFQGQTKTVSKLSDYGK